MQEECKAIKQYKASKQCKEIVPIRSSGVMTWTTERKVGGQEGNIVAVYGSGVLRHT